MKMRVSLLMVIGSIIAATSLSAQQTDNALQNKRSIDSILITEHLNKLDGNPKTFYSGDYKVRANAVQHLLSNCIQFYETQFPDRKFGIDLYVLNKTDWEKAPFESPFGVPGYYPENNLVIIATDKNAFSRVIGVPDDPDRSDSLVSRNDYNILHELGHYFFITLHDYNTWEKEYWMSEFIANYFLVCYIKEKHLAPEIEQVANLRSEPPLNGSLENFQKLYTDVGPANYGWYQRKFTQLGFLLYPQFKSDLIKAILQNYAPGGKNLDGLTLLKSLAPAKMDAWLKQMH